MSESPEAGPASAAPQPRPAPTPEQPPARSGKRPPHERRRGTAPPAAPEPCDTAEPQAPPDTRTGGAAPGGAPPPPARAAHLDCTAGVAGDMLLAALVDAGADPRVVADAVAALGVPGLTVRTRPARRGGFACLRAHVDRPSVPDRSRHLPEVLALLAEAPLAPEVARCARRVFELLAEAEAQAHGTTPERVHFHEVGAHDALADVVGCAAALADLGLLAPNAEVTCSALAAGSGHVTGAHGRMPVPVPAVLGIAARHGLALAAGELTGERTTPTGAALVGAVARPGPMVAMTVRAVGVGGGHRDTPEGPNITRVVVGEALAVPSAAVSGEVVVVESTVDDLDPRLWPSVLEALRAAGAWDCWTVGTVGRRGRPGRLVTALCAAEVRPAVTDVLLRHTTTLGVRWSTQRRTTLPRRVTTVAVGPPGREQYVPVKIADVPGGEVTVQPELAEAERAARALGWPVRQVCAAAISGYLREPPARAVPRQPPGHT
ncbi:nickel pincer cofactor biosynthesis protein LarC [Streptomyces sp. NPDC057676]|uniref:nickel pincer cofactor biosynthesis protein LarC n=1 Tax=Streptomyces sp. NPDC057676 TaxID=3346205 RepID=UPI0036C0612C